MSLYVFLVFQRLIFSSLGVAAGDEESSFAFCRSLRSEGAIPNLSYTANIAVLMDSMNYAELLPPRSGAVWEQVDNDDNNPAELTTNVSLCVV